MKRDAVGGWKTNNHPLCIYSNLTIILVTTQPPTYGDLLHILENLEKRAQEDGDRSTPELLVVDLHHKFPYIPISRPGHFLDTVR